MHKTMTEESSPPPNTAPGSISAATEQNSWHILPDELLSMVFGWLPPIDLLRSTVLVSRRTAALVQSEEFWRVHPLLKDNQLNDSSSFTIHQRQRCCCYWEACLKLPSNIPHFLQHGSVFVSRREACRVRDSGSGYRTCIASTTHQASIEEVENVLFDPDNVEVENLSAMHYMTGTNLWLLHHGRLRWWSSIPSPTSESNEVLLFMTRCPIALITEVKVKPLRDPYVYMETGGVYTWKKTLIRAFRIPQASLVNSPTSLSEFPCAFQTTALHRSLQDSPVAQPDQETIDRILAGCEPVYESQEYDVPAHSNEMLTYAFPRGGVVASVVTITLIGKNHEQQIGSGYYACVDKLDCHGIPLYAHPD
jgi:hypothetical protein